MTFSYIIVGRQIDRDNVKYLHEKTGKINNSHQQNGVPGTPLTVEYIGRRMVELSENPIKKGDAGYEEEIRRLKAAMVVRGEDGFDQANPVLDELLENTTLELLYDKRDQHDGQVDTNTRILVVPAPDTLKYREDRFIAQATGTGFSPPLTYKIDRLLMRNYFTNVFAEALEEFTDAEGNELDAATKQALVESVDKKLEISAEFEPDSADPADQQIADIIENPVSAFHRSVGIYITEMCN